MHPTPQHSTLGFISTLDIMRSQGPMQAVRPDSLPEATPGTRGDLDKPRWDLLPWGAISAVCAVATFGAAKYSDRNWEKGMRMGRIFASMMRHAWAFWRGEDCDKETGLPHTAHLAWNALALCHYSIHPERYAAFDDRPRYPESHQNQVASLVACSHIGEQRI
jgi:hypothetical protein